MSYNNKMSLDNSSVGHEKAAVMKYIFTPPGAYLGKKKEDNYLTRLQNMIEHKKPPKVNKSIDDLTTKLYSGKLNNSLDINYKLEPISYQLPNVPINYSSGCTSGSCYRSF